jgi:hypothetical protein
MDVLFKAKSIEEDTYGQWVYGYLVKGKWYLNNVYDMYVIMPTGVSFYPYDTVDEYIEVDPETICRFTGLSDGEYKIWEHDIFRYDNEMYEVMWCDESLSWDAVSVCSSESISLGEFSIREINVIGNSIENLRGEDQKHE